MRSNSEVCTHWMRVAVGVGLTVALLAWALRGMSPSRVWYAFQTAQVGWLVLSVFSLLASVCARAHRWGTLLGTECPPGSFDVRQSAVFIGCAGNYLLPAHAGELVRGLILKKRGNVSFGLGLSSIFVERVLDVVVLLIFILGSVLFEQGRQAGSHGLDGAQFAWIWAALLFVCIGLFTAIAFSTHIIQLVESLCHGVGLGRFTPMVVESVTALLHGLAVLRSFRRISIALVETVVIIGLTAMMSWAAMLAFGITAPGFTGATITQGVTMLGMAVPSAPGYLGTFEAAIRFSLELYAVPADAIIAYALALHILIFVTLVITGGALALRMGLSWSDMKMTSTTKQESVVGHGVPREGEILPNVQASCKEEHRSRCA